MMGADKELAAIVKELKELNRRLDRLCRASIFSLDEPVVRAKSKEPVMYWEDSTSTADKD